MDRFPHQISGSAWLRENGAGLLGDDPGCGKTRQLLEALPEHPAVLVICPNAVKGAWAAEVERWRPDLGHLVVDGRKSWRWPCQDHVTIANYDILPDGAASHAFFREQWKSGDGPLHLILDEAHYAKSSAAERTKRAMALAKAVREAGGIVWGATGTPILNDPMELWTILRVLGLEWKFLDGLPLAPAANAGWWPRLLQAFNGEPEDIFIRGGAGRKRQVVKWGQPLPCVADAFRRVALRRTKAEVLPNLPAKLYQDVIVELDAATARASDAALEALAAAGIDLETALRESADSAKTVPALEQFAHARAALATAKWPTLIQLVGYYREQGEPQVVFAAHRGPVAAVAAEAPGAATITGDVTAAKRTEIVERFQAGLTPVLACTIQAAGVGITLTRAAVAIFADLSPTPAMNLQAEDRLCRIGQSRGVRIIRLVADHALDRRILELCTRKTALAQAVLQDPIGPRRGPKSAEDLTVLARLEVAFEARLIDDPLAEDFALHAVRSVGSGGTLSEPQWAQLHQIAKSFDLVAHFALPQEDLDG